MSRLAADRIVDRGRRGATRLGSRPRVSARRVLSLRFVLALALLATSGCLGCASPPSAWTVVAPDAGTVLEGGLESREGERVSILDAPRVRRLGRRGWVEVDAAVLASDEESPAAARRRAIRRARRAAVEYIAGVSVRSSLVSLDQVSQGATHELLQELVATRSEALIVDEKLLDARTLMSTRGAYRVRVKLAARVLEPKKSRRGDFETDVRLDRSSYRPGDRVTLSVRTSQPARLYVLGVSDAGAVVLLPNRHLTDTRVAADEWLVFPGDDLEGRGVSLVARLPEGRDRSQEALIVVALRGNRRLEAPRPAAGAAFVVAEGDDAFRVASEFLSPLLSIPAEDWTFAQQVYSISADD